MCFPQFATSNINEKTEDNQKTQKILNNYFSKYLLVGKANFQFLFWNMYDAKLVSENGKYPSNKFALILKYNREFKKDSVVDETINQLKKQKTFNANEIGEVKLLLNKAFRDIKKIIHLLVLGMIMRLSFILKMKKYWKQKILNL